MSNDDSETASQALYELARWVDRDGVDSAHLKTYMARLLDRLIEVHATCRHEAYLIAEDPEYLDARGVAARLRETAFELERAWPVPAARVAHSSGGSRPNVAGIDRSIDLLPDDLDRDAPPDQRRSSWLPEFCAAVLFVVAGITFMLIPNADHLIRLTAAILYLSIGVIYSGAAIHQLRHHCHSAGSG